MRKVLAASPAASLFVYTTLPICARAEPNQPVILAAESKPGTSPQAIERTLFDIYLGDSFQGGVLAEYTEHWLEVDNPEDIIEQVKDLNKQQQSDLLPLFTGRIEGSREIEGIGKVTFDIYTFRLIISLSPQYLKLRKVNLTDRLPDPERGFSLQQNLGATVSGNSGSADDNNAAFSHRTVIGSGKFFSRINGAAIQNEDYELTEASAIGYVGDYEVSGGYLETRGFSFANSVQYTGGRLRTSDEILLDPERSTGNKFEIFVPSRSRVEFYRNERILSVQLLDFGMQEVDTSSFPQGSYDVDVVIIESSGNTIRDRKFFTKSGYLSIRGRPTYELQVGSIRDEFSTTDQSIYQAGIRWRATDILDVSAAIGGTDSLNIGSLELTTLYRETFMRLNGAVSSESDSGMSGSFSSTILGTTFSFGGAKTFDLSEHSRKLAPAPSPTPRPGIPPEFNRTTDRVNDLYFQDRSTFNASARRSIGKFDLMYQAQQDQFRDGIDRHSRGPSVQWRILDGSLDALRLQTSRYDTEQGVIFNTSLNYRHRLAPKWNLSSQLAYFNRETSGDEIVGYVTFNYDAADRLQSSSKLNYSTEVRSIEKNTDSGKGKTTVTNQLVGNYGGEYVQGQVFVRNQAGDGADKDTSYGVNAESAALISGDGAAALSYPLGKEAVFIADIKSSLPDAKFEILLNDQVYDTVVAGKRSAVGVEPFKTYRVYIRPLEGDELVEYDASTYTITFFPGNVVRKTFEAYKVIIVLGRLVDSDGQPIAFQRIRGPKDYVATDELGNFQAELAGGEKLSVESKDYKCDLEVELNSSTAEVVTELGDLKCNSTKTAPAQ